MEENSRAHHRPIRSFVKREGRLTPGQERALKELLPKYQLPDSKNTLDLATVFGNDNPVIMEIGFGNGKLLAQQAQDHPDYNFIGLEVHRPGVGHLLQKLEQNNSENVRIANEDAIEVLTQLIPEHSLYALWLFFPDPWPKKKHHKRRIVNPRFLKLVHQRLIDTGMLHMATDWQDYAEHMQLEVDASNLYREADISSYPFQRPQTHFEQRGLRKGHKIKDLFYQKK